MTQTEQEIARLKTRGDPIWRLYLNGHLGYEHVRAAQEIAEVFQAIAGALMPHGGWMELRWGGKHRPSPDFIERLSERVVRLRQEKYLPWVTAMTAQAGFNVGFLLAVIVDGLGVNTACKTHKLGWRRGVKMLRKALTVYVKLRRRPQRI